MPVSYIYVFFERMSIQVFCPFFDKIVFLILNCTSCLSILDIKPSLVASFSDILSHPIGCLFIFDMVSFFYPLSSPAVHTSVLCVCASIPALQIGSFF